LRKSVKLPAAVFRAWPPREFTYAVKRRHQYSERPSVSTWFRKQIRKYRIFEETNFRQSYQWIILPSHKKVVIIVFAELVLSRAIQSPTERQRQRSIQWAKRYRWKWCGSL